MSNLHKHSRYSFKRDLANKEVQILGRVHASEYPHTN